MINQIARKTRERERERKRRVDGQNVYNFRDWMMEKKKSSRLAFIDDIHILFSIPIYILTT